MAIHAALDELLKRQGRIQNKLAKKHLVEGCLVLYDLSSSYLVGEYEDSDLAEFGYSRDKKREELQGNGIKVSQLCDGQRVL